MILDNHPLSPGDYRCKPAESFWRHRTSWDYVLKSNPLRLYRTSDGECIAKAANAKTISQRLQKLNMRILEL
jgi:hypothetical protein